MLIGLLITAGIIALDQITKLIVELTMNKGQVIDIIPNFFYFTKVYNTGAGWSIFSDSTAFLAIISLMACFIFYMMLKKANFKEKRLYYVSISMILGGTAGNMIDRFLCVFKVKEGVVDFFGMYLGSYAFPIYNVADISLVFGIILLCIDMFFFDKKRENLSIQDKNNSIEIIEEPENETTSN